MKKKLTAILLAAIAAVVFCACSSGGGGNDININPVSQVSDTGDMWMGDVMPFYDGEVMNIYHLQNKTGSNPMWYHPIACVYTDDFLHYTERGIALDYEEHFDSPDAALGTGSFIKDENGVVHCFYTGHNDAYKDKKQYPSTPVEVIRHAVSVDNQKSWIKDESFSISNGNDDFRDPFVYYDSDAQKYYMLVVTRKSVGGVDTGVVERYSSKSLSAYADEWALDIDTFFVNDSGTYNPECPAVFKYNGFYYLTYSEQGAHRVTHYRYKKNWADEWEKAENDAIDGEGFYAGRPEIMNGTLYCFAWCAKTTTGDDTGAFDWAGNLVAHKIMQKPDGTLYPVMIPQVKQGVASSSGIKFADGGKLKDFEFEADKFESKTLNKLSKNITRMRFSFTFNALSGNYGLTFGLTDSYNNRLGNAVIAFDPTDNTLKYYNDAFSVIRYGDPLVTIPFKYEQDKKYNVDVVMNNQIISVYLANEIAMSIRIYSMPENYFAFYSNGANVKTEGIKIYE